MSLSIDEVIDTLRKLKVPSDILVKAETTLEQIEEDKKADKGVDAGPKAKSQFVTILLDPENKLQGLGAFTVAPPIFSISPLSNARRSLDCPFSGNSPQIVELPLWQIVQNI